MFASAISRHREPRTAVEQVIERVASQLAPPFDVMVVFATAHHRAKLDQITDQLMLAFSPMRSIGATAGGVIETRGECEDGPGLSVLVGRLPGAQIESFSYEQMDLMAGDAQSAVPLSGSSSAGAGPGVADGATVDATGAVTAEWAGDAVRAVVLLADPFSTPTLKLLSVLGRRWPGVAVMGAMASAGRQPGQNRLILDGQLMREGAVGLVIRGPVRVDCTVSQGCRPIGRPMVITRCVRQYVQELGGLPALESVQAMAQSLDDSDRQLLRQGPLLVGRVINEYKSRFGRGDFLIRQVVGVDSDTGAIGINDPQVRTGQTVQFHVMDRRTAEEDFQLLLDLQKLHGQGAGALLFSCNGRGQQFFGRSDADSGLVCDALGQVPLAGCFAAGEIGPIGGQAFLHGHTACLMVFRAWSEDEPMGG